MPDSLADRVSAAATARPPPVASTGRLWLVGTGPFHDAAELGMFSFAGSGRSAAAVSGEGHARLGELLGPQDACVLVGGDAGLLDFAHGVASGAGAEVVRLEPAVGPHDDPTTGFAVAGALVLAFTHGCAAPGIDEADLEGLAAAVHRARSAPPTLSPDLLGDRAIVMGSGPAAVTARHLAVALRRTAPAVAVEGLDAQNVPGSASDHLRPGTVVVALDPQRDPDAPVARMARMAAAEGAIVVELATAPHLGPVAAQIPLAVAAALGERGPR